MNASTESLTVGTTFAKDAEMPYTEAGVKHVHTFTTICEVTGMDETGFSYKVTDVVNEQSRPAFASNPTGGSVAWFVLPTYIARGMLRIN